MADKQPWIPAGSGRSFHALMRSARASSGSARTRRKNPAQSDPQPPKPLPEPLLEQDLHEQPLEEPDLPQTQHEPPLDQPTEPSFESFPEISQQPAAEAVPQATTIDWDLLRDLSGLAHFLSSKHNELSAIHAILSTQQTTQQRFANLKAEYINNAKDIFETSANIAIAWSPVAANVTDKTLSSHLILSLTKLNALANQLKTITARKENSPLDWDAEAQILSCSKNVVSTANTVLLDMEAAKLRLVPDKSIFNSSIMKHSSIASVTAAAVAVAASITDRRRNHSSSPIPLGNMNPPPFF